MDIIPIAPVPQQESSPPVSRSSRGNVDSGFGAILDQTISTQKFKEDPSPDSQKTITSDGHNQSSDDATFHSTGNGRQSAEPNIQAAELIGTHNIPTTVLPGTLDSEMSAQPRTYQRQDANVSASQLFGLSNPQIRTQDQGSADLMELSESAREQFVAASKHLMTDPGVTLNDQTGLQNSQSPATPEISPPLHDLKNIADLSSQQRFSSVHTSAHDQTVINPALIDAHVDLHVMSQQRILFSGGQNTSVAVPDDGEGASFISNSTNQSITPKVIQSQIFDSQHLSVVVKENPLSLVPQGKMYSMQNPILLAQLQELISQNNDRVGMTVSFNSPGNRELPGYLSSPVVLQATSDIALPAPEVTPEPIPSQLRAEIQQSTLRQEAQGQLLNVKTTSAEKQFDNQGSNDASRQNNTTQQQIVTMPQGNASLAATDQNLPLQGFSSQLQDISQQLAPEVTKVSQPSAGSHLPHVNEDTVVNQILQRFTNQSRLQTSRLRLNLHPAELGELKIDVIVKQDSLKANIFAQTQQAQEIIEKNLPRLRAMLQEQGISVDDLFVTLTPDAIDDFSKQNDHMFHGQLADFEHDNKEPENSSPEQSFEDTVLAVNEAVSGVNLTV